MFLTLSFDYMHREMLEHHRLRAPEDVPFWIIQGDGKGICEISASHSSLYLTNVLSMQSYSINLCSKHVLKSSKQMLLTVNCL